MYKNLSDLPIAMHDTGEGTLYCQTKVIDLLEKSQDRERYIAHFDQSLGLIDNIKKAIEGKNCELVSLLNADQYKKD